MICASCGASDNPDKAAFCQLCLSRFGATAGQSSRALLGWSPPLADRDWWSRRRDEYAQRLDPGFSESQWWAARHAEFSYAMENGLPPKSTVYALASIDAESRGYRAQWWSAAILLLTAWAATVRVGPLATGPLDRRLLSADAPTVLQALTVGAVGVLVARACAMVVSGADAWTGTLVSALFWAPAVLVLAIVACTGGDLTMRVIGLYALAAVATMAVMPAVRGRMTDHLPRP